MSEFTNLNVDKPGTLYDHIDRMRVMPVMWLTAMRRFTEAYQFALRQHGIDEHLDPPFQEFHGFCARYFQSSTTAGWCNIILADNFGQEEQALREFFTLFDQFRAREDVMRGRRIVTAFAREVAVHQQAWRARFPDFDRTLEACKPALCNAYRARIAHEYDAILRELERIAEQDAGVAAILDSAVKLGSVRPVKA
jgi:hypothetical protein